MMRLLCVSIIAGALLTAAGCAGRLPAGPITALETGEIVEGDLRAVQIEHRPDGTTLSLVSHDGVLISPETAEDEAFLLLPDDRRLRMIERLGDENVQRDRRFSRFW